MAAGSIAQKATYNNIMARLRVARDKYYSGYSVGNDVQIGTVMTAKQINDMAAWCKAVSAKSPKVYDFVTVSQGAIISQSPLDTNYSRINDVSNCHSNCHSNCTCTCTCQCTGRSGD